MIKFASYNPVQFLLKTTYEFDDSKVRIISKSLTLDIEKEIDYENIAHLDFREIGNSSLMNFGFFCLGITATIFTLFAFLGLITKTNFIVRTLAEAITTGGFIAYLWAHKRKLYCFLPNKSGDFLGNILITPNNYQQAFDAISLITNTKQEIKATNPDKPLPTEKAQYEIKEFDFPSGLKSTFRFYDDKIIEIQESIAFKSVIETNYADLSEKLVKIKRNNSDWFGYSLSSATLGSSLLATAFYIFRLPANKLIGQIIIGRVVFLLSPSLLFFIKEKLVGVYDKQGNLIHLINAKNKNIDQVIDFIRSKISSQSSNNITGDQ